MRPYCVCWSNKFRFVARDRGGEVGCGGRCACECPFETGEGEESVGWEGGFGGGDGEVDANINKVITGGCEDESTGIICYLIDL